MSHTRAISQQYFPTFSGYLLYGKQVSIREVLGLCLCLAIIQIMDGLLTGIGVSIYGTGAEGNLIIRSAMEYWGHIPALVVIKSLALLIIAALFQLSTQISWIAKALRALIMLYLVAAIYPWTVILVAEALYGTPILG